MKINEINYKQAAKQAASTLARGIGRGISNAVAPGAIDTFNQQKANRARYQQTAAGGTIIPTDPGNPNSYIHLGNRKSDNYQKNMAAAKAQDIAAGRTPNTATPAQPTQPTMANTAFGQFAQGTAGPATATPATAQPAVAQPAVSQPAVAQPATPASGAKVAKPKVKYQDVFQKGDATAGQAPAQAQPSSTGLPGISDLSKEQLLQLKAQLSGAA